MAKVVYRRFVPTFWNDPDVKRVLTRDQKTFLSYLFTNEHGHPCGIYRISLITILDELGFTPEESMGMFTGPVAPFATYDPVTEEVFVHAMAKHQIDEEGLHGKDKRIPWVEKQLTAVRAKHLVRAFRARYSAWNLDWAKINPGPEGNGGPTPQTKGLGKALGKTLPKLSTSESVPKKGNGSTTRKRKGHTKALGKPAAATATDKLSGSSPEAGRARTRESPPAEQPEGVAKAERRTAARRRARGMILGLYHLGHDVVELDEYRESMDVAMARWDAAVDGGEDPDVLTDRMALVRIVEEFPAGEPITVSVYFGRERDATRERCRAEWEKRQPVSRQLPSVDLMAMPPANAPPIPQTDPQRARRELEARIQEQHENRKAASA